MANEKYVKETFKPDKLWACPSFTGSSFPGITPPAEGGGGMYQIGEDLNFTLGSYYDYEIPAGTVNGDALYNAEYKAGAYVINKGYVYNYIGDSGYYHVFVNVRNGNALGSYGTVADYPVDMICEILAFIPGTASDPDGGAFCAYTCMPRGISVYENSMGEEQSIKVNGVKFYSAKYIDEVGGYSKLYQHEVAYEYDSNGVHLEISCPIVNAKSTPYESNDAEFFVSLITTGFSKYSNVAVLLDMKDFITFNTGDVTFPNADYFATNLFTGENFKLTNNVTLTFLADIVTEI